MKPKATAREIAYRILLNFDRNPQRPEELIEQAMKSAQLKSKERKFLRNLVSGCIRHRSYLDWVGSRLYTGKYARLKPQVHVIIRLALYEILYLDFIPPHASVNEWVGFTKRNLHLSLSKIVNGMLRNYLRTKPDLKAEKHFKYIETQLAVKYSFPEWLITRWLEAWGASETEKLCAAFNRLPDFDLRINERKISVDEFEAMLTKEMISFERSAVFSRFVKVADIQKIAELDWFAKGFCSVQDESALMPVKLLELKTGESLLDACAAPGGKLTAVLEQGTPRLFSVAVDSDGNRLSTVIENTNRLGLERPVMVMADARRLPLRSKFDKILLDVPCSGLGTIRKHPDIKWRRSIDEIMGFQKLQLEILEEAAGLLRAGGRMVYSTCSIDPAENEYVINMFLEKHKDFQIAAPGKELAAFTDENNMVRTSPHRHKMDGSFAVALEHKHASN